MKLTPFNVAVRAIEGNPRLWVPTAAGPICVALQKTDLLNKVKEAVGGVRQAETGLRIINGVLATEPAVEFPQVSFNETTQSYEVETLTVEPGADDEPGLPFESDNIEDMLS